MISIESIVYRFRAPSQAKDLWDIHYFHLFAGDLFERMVESTTSIAIDRNCAEVTDLLCKHRIKDDGGSHTHVKILWTGPASLVSSVRAHG